MTENGAGFVGRVPSKEVKFLNVCFSRNTQLDGVSLIAFFCASTSVLNVRNFRLLCIFTCLSRLVSPFLQATKALRESKDIAVFIVLDLGTRRGRFLPLGKTLYPLCRRLSGLQGRFGQCAVYTLYITANLLYMFRVQFTPIIRSTGNCSRRPLVQVICRQ
jgi:hypothetical protein